MEKVVKCKNCDLHFGYSEKQTKCPFCYTEYGEEKTEVKKITVRTQKNSFKRWRDS